MKKIVALLLKIFTTLFFLGCLIIGGVFYFATKGAKEDPTIGGSKHKDYVSEYTQEEHILRISEVTKINAEKNWNMLFRPLMDYKYEKNGIKSSVSRYDVYLKDFTVEIVYSIYDNDPEYFLVQIKGEKYKSVENADIPTDVWYLGIIRNDSYATWEDGVGINPYAESGNGATKKYYGSGHFAVDTGDGVLKELKYNKDTDGWDLVALTEEEKSTYGEFNDPCGALWGYDVKDHVDYEDKYFPHRGLISQKTEKRFKKERMDGWPYSGDIALKGYTMETVYSIYDNDPEYFLVQIQLAETVEVFWKELITTDKVWYILLFQNDEYYIFDYGCGQNPYVASGFGESVKYHAFGHYAVQTGENELTEVIYDEETGVWEQHVLTDSEKRIYGEYNDATDCDLYYKE